MDRPAIIEVADKGVHNIPGSEWTIFRLGTTTMIVSIDIDTNHFKGNAPESVTIEGTKQCGDYSTTFDENQWTVILDKMKVQPHKLHSFKREIKNVGPFNCIRVTIVPDGGVSRIRIHGQRYVDLPTEPANSKEKVTNSKDEETNSKEETVNSTEETSSLKFKENSATNDTNHHEMDPNEQKENNANSV